MLRCLAWPCRKALTKICTALHRSTDRYCLSRKEIEMLSQRTPLGNILAWHRSVFNAACHGIPLAFGWHCSATFAAHYFPRPYTHSVWPWRLTPHCTANTCRRRRLTRFVTDICFHLQVVDLRILLAEPEDESRPVEQSALHCNTDTHQCELCAAFLGLMLRAFAPPKLALQHTLSMVALLFGSSFSACSFSWHRHYALIL